MVPLYTVIDGHGTNLIVRCREVSTVEGVICCQTVFLDEHIHPCFELSLV